MNKTMILEAAFDAVSDSLKWGFDVKDELYAYYISGIIDLTNKLTSKLTEPTPIKDTECDF